MKKKQKFNRLKHTLMLAFIVLSITPFTLLALFFLETHSSDLKQQRTEQLAYLRDSQKLNIEKYFQSRELEVKSFSRSELATASGGRFYGLVAAFHQLGETSNQAAERLKKNFGEPQNTPTTFTDNFAEYERYRLLHQRYDHGFQEHLKGSDFEDILLVEIGGQVVYSAQKGQLFGENLNHEQWQSTAVGQIFQQLKVQSTHLVNQNNHEQIILTAFEKDSKNQYIAWFATPIIQKEFLHSYLIFKLPSAAVTQLLQSEQLAQQDVKANLFDQSSQQITKHTDTIAPIAQNKIRAAIGGVTTISYLKSPLGVETLAAFTPLNILDQTWALLLEIPTDKAFSRIYQLENILLVIMFAVIVFVVFASHWLSNFITAPLLKLTWIAEQVADGDLDQTISSTERSDEIGRLAQSFSRMQHSIREKMALIKQQNQQLEKHIHVIQNKNQRLEQTNQLKDDFLVITSQELRTPLHGMIGIAESLLAGLEGLPTTRQKGQLEIMINSGHRLSALVDDLLDYHKMKDGSLTIQTKALDTASVVRIVTELSSHLIGSKPVRIINQIPIDLPLMRADEQRLEQVLSNLIGLAIKATDEGKIIISAQVIHEKIRLQIVDTGHGFASEDLNRFFDPFHLENFRANSRQKNIGLGLSISRQLIEIMGGQLYVSSQLMVGTTFSFTMPIATAEDISKTKLARALHFQAPLSDTASITLEADVEDPNAPLVLVVDDELVNRQVLHNFLTLAGYRVKAIENGRQAIEFITQTKPHLMLLDVMMPELSGYEVCQHLRERYTKAELPIILLSALGQVQDKMKGFNAGANDYLTKPFNKEELGARINAYIHASLTANVEARLQAMTESNAVKERKIKSLTKSTDECLQLFENTHEAILVLDQQENIIYRNSAMQQLLLDEPQANTFFQLIDYFDIDLSCYPTGTHKIQVTIRKPTKQRLPSRLISCDKASNFSAILIIERDVQVSSQRLNDLERALSTLSKFAFYGDLKKLEEFKSIGAEFAKIAEKPSETPVDKQQLLRENLAKLMQLSLTYWQENTGKNKFDLAEESNIWRVYLDRSTLQTRTLDKYLLKETIPKTPRWKSVLNTAEYVLNHVFVEGKMREEIKNLNAHLISQLSK